MRTTKLVVSLVTLAAASPLCTAHAASDVSQGMSRRERIHGLFHRLQPPPSLSPEVGPAADAPDRLEALRDALAHLRRRVYDWSRQPGASEGRSGSLALQAAHEALAFIRGGEGPETTPKPPAAAPEAQETRPCPTPPRAPSSEPPCARAAAPVARPLAAADSLRLARLAAGLMEASRREVRLHGAREVEAVRVLLSALRILGVEGVALPRFPADPMDLVRALEREASDEALHRLLTAASLADA